MKIDLHVHSKYSRRPSIWLLQKLSCPESFTEPVQLYDLAMQRGMDAVTVTDHNCIDAGLDIAHLPRTFVSEEVTTYFPEDRCKIHVLVYNHNEAIHREIQRLRKSVYDLVEYLQGESVPHAIAHPLSAVNDHFTPESFEKMMLLFKVVELNGDLDQRLNDTLRHMLAVLTAEDIERLAEKHRIEPAFDEPWKKHLISGSDDHSGLRIAASSTEVPGAESIDGFFSGIAGGKAQPRLQAATPRIMSRNIYAVAYGFAKRKLAIERYVNADLLLKFLERSLAVEPSEAGGFFTRLYFAWNRRRSGRSAPKRGTVVDMVRHEAAKMIKEDPRLMAIVEKGPSAEPDPDRRWFAFLNQVSNNVLAHTGRQTLDRAVHGQILNLFHGFGSAASLYLLLAPYFVTFSMFASEREIGKNVAARFLPDLEQEPPRVAHFTDTFYEVNGVARTLQQWINTAVRMQKQMTVITCHDSASDLRKGIVNFNPVGSYTIPEYEEIKLQFPPFLEMMNYCYDQNFTHIHSATPGPVGLAALAIAKILKRPLFGTYHTQFPQYADILTDDASIGEMVWRYMLWYYDQMDVIFVSSRASATELVEKGIRAEKIRLLPRGVDTKRFHPDKRGDILESRFNVPKGKRLLYVGRVSKEKNLPRLAEAFKVLREVMPDAQLVITGDGPYRQQMATQLADCNCTFTGYLHGEELPQVYASCDLFVFPSKTDTFGNVVLEAQAAGLPVVVTNVGGPQENLVPGETGLVVEADETGAYTEAIRAILNDPEKHERMRRAARAYIDARSFENAFEQMWENYAQTPHPTSAEDFLNHAQSLVSAL